MASAQGGHVRPLATDRLLLRMWEPTDAEFVYDLYSRWEVQRFIGLVPRVMEGRSEADRLIEKCRGFHHPVQGFWAVERVKDSQLVGTILLKGIPASGEAPLQLSGDTEIGWHFHPDYWGKGYATEAASAVLAHGFSAGLDRVIAITSAANTASQSVCRRIGMKHQGVTKDYYNAMCELYRAEAASWLA
ncbi:GNAT family N-acetyltransferase [Arthrobacter sp. CAL618]|uniref:GNAT family N-acetyltransferase n=1 Tax=Arthrobacter sp. CAL618 TaxID=1055770 RepID=UPI0009FC8EE6|nr:GNAT family N-acetyltransferase [Arthrobacter sp. CAL618]